MTKTLPGLPTPDFITMVNAILSSQEEHPDPQTAYAVKRYKEILTQHQTLQANYQSIEQQMVQLRVAGERFAGQREGYFEDIKRRIVELHNAEKAPEPVETPKEPEKSDNPAS